VDDLVAWLRAQLDDDERVASRISESQRTWNTAGGWPETGPDTVMAAGGPVAEEVDEFDAEHIARWDPARVLAEVDAKRRIIDSCARHAGFVRPAAVAGTVDGVADRGDTGSSPCRSLTGPATVAEWRP
jgi:hypothetical protein